MLFLTLTRYVCATPGTYTNNLGPKEACTGLTFVSLSRAKRLVDLMVRAHEFRQDRQPWKLVDEG